MKDALQELLPLIPLDRLKFFTALPKQLLYYETIQEELPKDWLEKPTLIIIVDEEEWIKLNDKEFANQLIQDPNLIAVIIGLETEVPLQEDIVHLYRSCQLPIVQVADPSSLHIFEQKSKPVYSQISNELAGIMNEGFTAIATELAKGLETPFLYLDENNHLLWQTGTETELREANRWLNTHFRELEGMKESYEGQIHDGFELYPIHIAGVVSQGILASAKLVDWQKRMVDKLIGLMALLLQTEGMFRQQQQQLQEHFVYDLLYHKFESQKVMIKQAKAWDWNLEIPHHLLLVHVKVTDELMDNMDWLDEMVLFIEEKKSHMEERLIVLPFEDQIVVLLEDGQSCTISERNRHVRTVAEQIEKELSNQWPNCQFLIGIGKWYKNTTFLNKSYQEANQALKFGQAWFENRNIFHINDLGALRLLIHIHQEILLDYSEDYLSVLLESDRESGTELIHTLKVYIQHQGVINDVADALFIHPNTLRNRIKKIEDMTGINVQDPEEFMNLMVAVKILSFLNL